MKKCIITGSNSGIGRAAAFQLAEKGCTLILACRNITSAEKTRDEIIKNTGNQNVFAMRVDLSLISDVKNFVKEYAEKHGSLDILINNAADFDLSRKSPSLTAENNETQFATNHLAPFALTNGLLPLLLKSHDGRIINIASQGLILYPNIKFDFENIKGEKHYSPAKTYYQTKLAQLMFSISLKEKLTDTNISVYAVRVTNVKVDINRYPNLSAISKFMYKVKSRFSISPEEMAKVYVELALGEKRNGLYYDENLKEVKANKNAYDKAARDMLWDISEKLTR